MDYKRIHDYFDDKFPLQKENDTSINFRFPDTNYEIVLIPVIGKVSDVQKNMIKETIHKMINEDPSHTVAGTYSITNITTRPDNIYILIICKNEIEFILNIHENENVYIHSYLFSHFENPFESTAVLNQIVVFLSIFDRLFVFASGIDLTEFLESNLDYDGKSIQIVFRLKKFITANIEDMGEFEYLVFDGESNNSQLEVIRAAYGYKDREQDLIRYLGVNPHIVIRNKISNEIVAKARINAISDKFVVVGGVETIKKYRRRGLGYHVSYLITQFIKNRTENVVLDTDTKNFPAIKIYEKIGFVKIGKSIFMEKGKKVIAAIHGDRDY